MEESNNKSDNNTLSNGSHSDLINRLVVNGEEVECDDGSSNYGDNQTRETEQPTHHLIFATQLQMKLKSHIEQSSSSSEEYLSSNDDNNTEIFYDFPNDEDNNQQQQQPQQQEAEMLQEELTSDYGTGTSNSTIIGDGEELSNCGGSSDSSVVVEEEGRGDEEEDRVPPRYQRSSSLKSGKTPPGTPMTKKFVRFADAMGLDLIDIKVFLDEIPRVPKEAYRDLHIPDYHSNNSSNSGNSNSSLLYGSSPINTYDFLLSSPSQRLKSSATRSGTTTLNFVPLFHQPVTMPDFFDKIRDQKVLLENAYLTIETITNNKPSTVTSRHVIKGTVRVMNLDFHKSVYIRYTYNDWKEFVDFQATYIPSSCDGFSDRFEFNILIDESKLPPPYLRDQYDDAKITFACRFHCQGNQFWDNNQSRNYVFQNVPSISSSSAVSSSGGNVTNATRLSSNSSRYSSFDDFDYDDGSSFIANKPIISTPSALPEQQKSKPTTTNSSTSPTPQNYYIIKPTTPTENILITKATATPPKRYNYEPTTERSCGSSSTTNNSLTAATGVVGGAFLSGGGGGGSHLSSNFYSPSSPSSLGFYESAYGCYSNNYSGACFY